MVIPSGHEDGSLRFYQADNNAKRVQVLKSEPIHKRAVTDLKMTDDKLSASRFHSQALYVRYLETVKNYRQTCCCHLLSDVILGNRCVA